MYENKLPHVPVVIIGAGIVGACIAVRLIKEGQRVIIVDKAGPAAGASSGNAGAISPGSCSPLAEPGMLKSVPKWLFDRDGPLVIRKNYLLQAFPWLLRFIAAGRRDRFESISDALFALHSCAHESYAPLLRFADATKLIAKTGALTVYETPEAYQASRASWEVKARRGISHRVLDGPQIQEMVPALGKKFSHAVLLRDHGYAVDPQKLVYKLFDAACRSGADFIRDKATSIGPTSDFTVVTFASGRQIAASHVVIAAGAASSELLRGLSLSIPLERQRGYHLHLPDPGIELPLPISFARSKFYATPMGRSVRLAGTVEFARADAAPDFQRADRLGVVASRWIDGLKVDGATKWMGNRPCLPDSLPIIDQVAQQPNVILAFGHGHNGMTSAPATARLVADLVARRKPFIDIKPYRSNRFS